MTKNVKKSCAVIGDGVAANTFIFYLLEKSKDIEVTQFFEESFFPKSSTKSTAIVANRNIAMGVSEYGDLLYKSFIELNHFYSKYSEHFIDSIEIVTHKTFGNGVDFHRKFPEAKKSPYGFEFSEDAFLFYPSEFLAKLREFNYIKRESLIISSYDQLAKYDFIVDCSGHYMKFLNTSGDSKTTSGAYLRTNFNFDHSFSISMHHCNLIYRKKYQELIIGSSTGDAIMSKKDFNHLRGCFKTLTDYKLVLPEFHEFELIRSFRHKMRKRLPVWRELSDNRFINGGYYKNGYQFSFLAAKELSEMIKEKL